MGDHFKLQQRAMKQTMEAAEAGMAAWSTIAMRMSLFAMGSMSLSESQRMVQEKAEAAAQGMVAMTGAMVQSVFNPPRTMAAMMNAGMVMVEAASAPARRAAIANSRRLRRR